MKSDKLIDWFCNFATEQLDSQMIDDRRGFPPHLIPAFAQAGMFGMSIPQRYGGLGFSSKEILRVLQQLAAVDLSVAIFVLDAALGASTVRHYRDSERRAQTLKDIAAGRIVTAIGITGPEAGSDPRAITASAKPDGNGNWLITGEKRWVGNAAWADVIHVFVQLLDENSNTLGLTGFAIKRGTPGLTIGSEVPTMGLRGFPKNSIHLDSVRVGPDDLIGQPGLGMETAQETFHLIRLLLGGMTSGTMKRCLQLMHRYASQRKISTGRLLDNPVTQLRISETVARITIVDTLAGIIAVERDAGNLVPDEAYMVIKNIGAEFMGQVVDWTIQILGARGYEETNGVARMLRDARAFRIFEGPTESLAMYIGASVLQNNFELSQFISNTLKAPDLAAQLSKNAQAIQDRCRSSKAPFSGSNQHYHAYAKAGEYASELLMLAALHQSKDLSAPFAVNWAKMRVRSALSRAMGEDEAEFGLITVPILNHVIDKWGEDIKEVEQRMSIAYRDTDSLLRPTTTTHPTPKWNDTAVDFGDFEPVWSHFHRQVQQHPDKVAVQQADIKLTYAALEARAQLLAQHLVEQGLRTGEHVAIFLPRHPDGIIAMLGISLAGGAWVPLDPAYPDERRQMILSDANCRFTITHQALADRLPQGVCSISLDRPLHASTENLEERKVNSNDTAYIMYTSGSTGKPKGTVIPHGALTNFTLAAIRTYEISSADTVLQFASPSFDTAIEEIFPCLCSGGRLILRTDEMLGSASHFLEKVSDLGITVLDLPTAYWHQLVDDLSAHAVAWPTTIRLLIIGGERCRPESWRLWHRHVGDDCRLLNTYGPTETTVVATACDLSVFAAENTQLLDAPIGTPLPNVRCHVLDEHLQPVEVGEVGELYIAGDGVAQGYLHRETRTAEAFVTVNLPGYGNEYLYRTGDLTSWHNDGYLCFVGRADNQVKIRGYRVELGEIEATLATHAQVREVAEIAKISQQGITHLVAYVESSDHNIKKQLQKFLKARLPEYMIPATIMVLDTLPMTVSGKVDRQALPEPNVDQVALDTGGMTATEQRLAELWQELLSVDVTPNDDFLNIGGNSLLAIQLVARINEIFGVDLSIAEIFRSGTIAAIAGEIDQGRQLQQAPITVIERDEPVPLSYGQNQLWFLHMLTPGQPVYNEPCTLLIPEPVNAKALEASFQELIARHEALRTSFRSRQGQPVQQVVEPIGFSLETETLATWDEKARDRAKDLLRQPFELNNPPLLRARLVQTGELFARLVLVLHHLIVDGVSFYGVFLKELQQLYEAFTAEQTLKLPPLRLQYVDFAAWQAAQSINEESFRYWQTTLADAPRLQLPTDRTPPSLPSFRGDHVAIDFGSALTRRLRNAAHHFGVTPFMLLATLIKILLLRITGQDDIILGTVVTQRNHPDLEGVIGYFDNTLALRTSLSGDISFEEALGRVRETILNGFTHQHVPFQRVVESLGPIRSGGRSPLVQVMLVFEPATESGAGSWTFSRQELHTGTAKFDIMIEIEEHIDRLSGRIEFSNDLFDTATIERLRDHLFILSDDALDRPQTSICTLRMLDLPMRQQLLFGWNDTGVSFPNVSTAHELFEATAASQPEAPAARFNGEEMSYTELDGEANKLAHALLDHGVRLGDRVGLFVERGFDLIVGVLGILKAGASYVPLDVSYPPERRALMLEDAGVAALITQTQLASIVDAGEAPVICLDELDLAIYPETSLEVEVGPEDLVYVIYTSGSTGRPKGVSMPHRALVNLVHWQLENSQAGVSARTLQFSPISFDVSFQELFSTWAAGGVILLIPEQTRREPRHLLELMKSEKVKRAYMPVALLGQLADAATNGAPIPTDLAEIIVAGEQLNITPRVRSFFNQMSGTELHNHYGPSETHVVTALPLKGSPDAWPTRPSIGRPIANTAIYILDEKLAPVPIGIAGELYIAGTAVAHGYFRQTDLTTERFLDDPFTDNEKMYRSGDRARWLADGNIEFLGRRDNQVKLRGYRVELGEVETALNDYSDVREAAVGVVETDHRRKYLVAWVDMPGQTITDDLQTYLQNRLPDYMVPQLIMLLDKLPKTPSGKVARRLLPKPEFADSPEAKISARDTIELQMAGIWADVLEIEHVSLQADFFKLGGHSLLAVSMMARIEQSFGVQLPLATLFQDSTVESLATRVRGMYQHDQQWKPVVPIQPSGWRPPLFCVPGSGGNVLYFQALATALGADQPLYGLQPRGLDGITEPFADFRELALEQVEAIKAVQPRGPYFIAGHSVGGCVALENARVLEEGDDQVGLLIMLDFPAPIGGERSWRNYDDARWVYAVSRVLEHGAGKDLGLELDKLRQMSKSEQRAQLKAAMENAGLLPPNTNQAHVDGIVQTMMWTDLTYADYYPEPIDAPVLLVRAKDAFEMDDGSGLAIADPDSDDWGWAQLAEKVNVAWIPGHHLSILRPPFVEKLGEVLLEGLAAGRGAEMDPRTWHLKTGGGELNGDYQLSQVQCKKMEWWFQVYNVDNSGYLNMEDYFIYLRRLQDICGFNLQDPKYKRIFNIQQEWWEGLIQHADKNDDGEIDLEEWMTWATEIVATMRRQNAQTGERPYDEWGHLLFQLIDANHNGEISIAEYAQYMQALNSIGGDIDHAWQHFDPEGIGHISEARFSKILEDFWESDEPETPGNFFFAVPYGYFNHL